MSTVPSSSCPPAARRDGHHDVTFLLRPRPWAADAACVRERVNVDDFFPPQGTGDAHYAGLRTRCNERCPVLAECRDDVLTFERGNGPKSRPGFVAGMNGRERYMAEQSGYFDAGVVA